MIKTYQFRLKGKNLKSLNRMADSVNQVWNYVNQTSIEYLDKKNKWLSKYELQRLTTGCSKYLKIPTSTIQLVGDRYNINRERDKKRKLAWRSMKRSAGWIPFRDQAINVKGDIVTYNKTKFRIWLSRPIEGKIKCGEFSCDSSGNWFVTFSCEAPKVIRAVKNSSVGIDLGLKTIATLSTGAKLSRENITNKFAIKLAACQLAKKKKQVANIHAKIKNTRKDWTQKQTTNIVNNFDLIFVGNVSSSKLKKTRMAKSVSDAGWADFKSMLAYKAIALGVEFKEVKENFSTVTCSACLQRTGPNGLRALGVREWICPCGTSHDRDVNAAKNILRFGHESPKGAFFKEVPSSYGRQVKAKKSS